MCVCVCVLCVCVYVCVCVCVHVCVCEGGNVHMKDTKGKCAFEYIRDYEEWIQSGHFSTDTISSLKGNDNKIVDI